MSLPATIGAIGDSQSAREPAKELASPAAKAAAETDAVFAAAAEVAEAAEPPSAEEVQHAARQIEAFMRNMNRYLEFRVDQDSGRTVVTVRDKTTGEVVRQIPSEEVLRLAHNLGGKLGTLLSETV
jgi:flagellar protein FlaG